MILANVLALAASAELPARVVFGFVDSEVALSWALEERRAPALAALRHGARFACKVRKRPAVASRQ